MSFSYDQNSFSRFYEKSGRVLILRARRYLSNHQAADEAVAEAFLKLWKSKPALESERHAFRWMYRTVTHRAIDSLRRESHAGVPIGEEIENAITSVSGLDTKVMQKDWLARLLKNLSDLEVRIVMAISFEGMSQEDAAHFLGISRSTVVRHFDHAKTKLLEYRRIHEQK